MKIASAFGAVLDRIGAETLRLCEQFEAKQLNAPLGLPESNTAFQLATHIAGATEFWVVEMGGGIAVRRDRPQEFRASGSIEQLRARYADWMSEVRSVLESIDDRGLSRVVTPKAEYAAAGGLASELTVADCILHAIEHAALHLGHLEITRQIVARARD
jgi:uncharacterized damage-inducible protein DinB